ncbi:acyl carrier protein [Streptomyces caatingaensis]|uniref:Carrier domain-containing protein n=1 Tax=Streptomyces caatingaensis TaxID=1678637 RepID=A0A0K9X906_9ACTN|nr:acyl carrier protein [Streptomyces caatingaensis]KNB49920.1 hypothetical protein AC230_24590 [Streptomyces caatingaensis]
MNEFTLSDLEEILSAASGTDEPVELGGERADAPFAELGLDSLAILELCGRLERRYGVSVADDAVAEMPTPAAAVAYVNALLAKARA